MTTTVSAQMILRLGTGGITPHFSAEKKDYCNQWNNTGIIVNKNYQITLGTPTYQFTYMQGNDSICSPIEGIFFTYIHRATEYNEIGVIVGGYAYDAQNWIDHEKTTPAGIEAPSPIHMDYFGRDVVPMLALSWNLTLIKKDRWSIKIMSIITHVITNHSIGWEYRF